MFMMNLKDIPDDKVHGANMGPRWVLSSPGGPHAGPMNLVIRDVLRDGIAENCTVPSQCIVMLPAGYQNNDNCHDLSVSTECPLHTML